MDYQYLKDFYFYLKSENHRVRTIANLAASLGFTRQYTTEVLNGTANLTESFVNTVKKVYKQELELYDLFKSNKSHSPNIEATKRKMSSFEILEKLPESYKALTFENGTHGVLINDNLFLNRMPLVNINDNEYCRKSEDTGYLYSLPSHFLNTERDFNKNVAFINIGKDMFDGSVKSLLENDVLIASPFSADQLYNVHESKRVFVIVHHDRTIVRNIIHYDKETIFCSALNPDKGFYPDLKIKISEIKEIFLVNSLERSMS